MAGPDLETPRGMGAFVLVLDPDAFAGGAALRDAMTRYLAALRGGSSVPGETLMAPGDQEWAEAARRRTSGIPLDAATAAALRGLGEGHRLPFPA